MDENSLGMLLKRATFMWIYGPETARYCGTRFGLAQDLVYGLELNRSCLEAAPNRSLL
jgi:hypothetical protein